MIRPNNINLVQNYDSKMVQHIKDGLVNYFKDSSYLSGNSNKSYGGKYDDAYNDYINDPIVEDFAKSTFDDNIQVSFGGIQNKNNQLSVGPMCIRISDPDVVNAVQGYDHMDIFVPFDHELNRYDSENITFKLDDEFGEYSQRYNTKSGKSEDYSNLFNTVGKRLNLNMYICNAIDNCNNDYNINAEIGKSRANNPNHSEFMKFETKQTANNEPDIEPVAYTKVQNAEGTYENVKYASMSKPNSEGKYNTKTLAKIPSTKKAPINLAKLDARAAEIQHAEYLQKASTWANEK